MKNRYYSLRLAFLLGLLSMIMPALSARAQTSENEEKPTKQEIAIHYSLYYEDYKNGNYEGALPNLRWILKNAPGFSRNTDKNFDRAVKVYEELAMAAEDEQTRRAYLDSALMIFDKAVPTIKDIGGTIDEYEWTRDKGNFILKHRDDLPDMIDSVAVLFRKAWELDPKRTQLFYIEYIIRDYLSKDDKRAAIDFMEEVEQKRGDDPDVMARITEFRNVLFTSPEERIAFLEEQLEKNPGDMDIITELFELYKEEGMRDKMYEMGEKLKEQEPTARVYRILGKMRLEDGDTEEAIRLYQKSLELDGGKENAREVYYNIGIAHQQEGRLSRARTAFRKALQADPNYGLALIAIGDLYVQSVQNCGSFEREDRAVYWLATDYFERAKARDPSVANMANQRIKNIRRFYPTAEDKFFKGWNAGDKYTINYGCYEWINETTTVR
ncbi:tetratricopeptide repeat protein [Rhodocaloribacter sp.]